jgi:hypothetical protein
MAHVLLHRSLAGMHERAIFELSTHVFACAAALRERTGVPLPATSRRVYQPDLEQLQALLGPSEFDAAWGAGRGMPVRSLSEQLLLLSADGAADLGTMVPVPSAHESSKVIS